MARARTKVNLSHGAVRAESRRAMALELQRFLRQTENRAKVLVPVDNGYLRSQHKIRIRYRALKVVGQLLAVTDYAAAVHEGWKRTAPIVPKGKKALRFRVNGRTVIVARVNAPASYPGRPWLWRALQQVSAQNGYKARRVYGGGLAEM